MNTVERWEFTRWSGNSPDAVKNAAMEVARLVYYRQREWPRREWGDIGQLETYSIAQLAKVIYPVLRDAWPQAQPEQPAEQEFHRVFEANESLEESLVEQPEAGRDVQRLAMVAAEQIAEEAHPKLDQYKRGPEVRRYAEIIASHFKGTHPQTQEAVAWRLKGYAMGGDYLFFEDEGDALKCCGRNERPEPLYRAPAEAVELLARTLPWIEFANEKAGEAGDKKNSADLHDDVSDFLAQHGGRGDE